MVTFLPHNLKILRKKHNLTQPQLAKAIGITRFRTIKDWEHGYQTPHLNHLIIIARRFNISLDRLILTKIINVNNFIKPDLNEKISKIIKKKVNKNPKDTNQNAKLIAQIATNEVHDNIPTKNPSAISLGRLGGLKGGKNRAKSLTPTQHHNIAKNAAQIRSGQNTTKITRQNQFKDI